MCGGGWVALSPVVKRPTHEAGNPLPSSAVATNAWSYTSTYPYFFIAWYLVKVRTVSRLTMWPTQPIKTCTGGKEASA
jgi:hypothetical protein